ncbi:hypothetical protein HNR57_006333 [Streptomyces paradoxus]|uniref:Uncharacterized protein n=1 Tax=Streptomyces paradoxus TaxID=66375 RepID=A0A7W9TGW4_9ACTN|nr:hypothetical protein [Streptomyces paradoxus]
MPAAHHGIPGEKESIALWLSTGPHTGEAPAP